MNGQMNYKQTKSTQTSATRT